MEKVKVKVVEIDRRANKKCQKILHRVLIKYGYLFPEAMKNTFVFVTKYGYGISFDGFVKRGDAKKICGEVLKQILIREKEIDLTVKYQAGYSCNDFRTVTGTPTEIIKVMFENRSPFLEINSLKEYMPAMLKRAKMMWGIKRVPKSKNPERYALAFLKIMDKIGDITILPIRR